MAATCKLNLPHEKKPTNSQCILPYKYDTDGHLTMECKALIAYNLHVDSWNRQIGVSIGVFSLGCLRRKTR